MSSVKREYSQGASSLSVATVSSGNGTTGSKALVFIDPRISSVFTVDLSGVFLNNVNVRLNTFLGAPGAVAGKEITVLFSVNPDYNGVHVFCTDNFGPHANKIDTYLYGDDGVPLAVKFVSDGTDFVLLSSTNANDS